MSTNPIFQSGDPVILRTTRELGAVVDEPELDGGEYWYRVKFEKRIENCVEEDLEPVEDTDQSIRSLLIAGKWGRLQAFRTALAVERITHINRSTVYSFKAQRILFQAYQYKPLLKILDSLDRRLLIADEVGLGKTIEAGLIMTELQARRQLDRILIICPSRLRDKWREELNRKFDQDFEIFDKKSLEQFVMRVRENPKRQQLRAIISMQVVRREEIREMITNDLGALDLVIVDEAHHARNPSSLTSEMLCEVCQITDCVVMLTATPLHLGSRDLYTLLHALRPAEFRDADFFDRQLKHHARVIEAGRFVRTQQPEHLDAARQLLEEVFVHQNPSHQRDPLAMQVIEHIRNTPPTERHEWVNLERRIQDLHPLASIVTRTRKREVLEDAPTRQSYVLKCAWTEAEEDVYNRLVGQNTSRGWTTSGLGFGQIQRARQAASCLPAAIEAQADRIARDDDEAVDQVDVLPSDLNLPARSESEPLPSVNVAWSCRDSKYDGFRQMLAEIWETDPNSKVIVFTFFVGTSKYLTQRLEEEGVRTLRIAGDVPSNPHNPNRDERGQRVRAFREDPDIRVLVSTEVGSEGLDFQFCHHLVNYDLPWNPMVVEQRIGRIDRFGQESEVITIHNLVVEGTVEDRILYRLYERIGIFKDSLGDLETILGEAVRELQRDYFTGRLTPKEAEKRVDQAAWAIEQRQAHAKTLEQKAEVLFGHEEHIRAEMQRVGRLGRFISEASIIAVISSYLESHHPGLQLLDEDDSVYSLRLTHDLTGDLTAHEWLERPGRKRILFTTQGEVAFRRPDVELVNVSHPLVRAALERVTKRLENDLARVGQAVLELPENEDEAIPSGICYVVVFTQVIEGIRARQLLETVAWSAEQAGLLDSETSERLLHLVLKSGREWDLNTSGPATPEAVWQAIQSEARKRNRKLLALERTENEALFHRRSKALEAEYEHIRETNERRIQTAEERNHHRGIALFRSQINKARSNFETKIRELVTLREVQARLSEPVAACVIEVRRTNPTS
ncbi:MAG: SNF2-related protein [Gemmataceae bacterium]